jgi:hypothetical protein
MLAMEMYHLEQARVSTIPGWQQLWAHTTCVAGLGQAPA